MIYRNENSLVDTIDQETDATHARWEAWVEGKRWNSVYFIAPIAGTYDIVGAAADILGVDINSEINVEMVRYV